MIAHIILYIGAGMMGLLAISALHLRLQRIAHPVCRLCGRHLNADNTVTVDDDEDICIHCYARQIAPEQYEHYFDER